MLIDTCVWLELAKDHREQPVIGALQYLVRDQEVELIVPELVREEFARNKARVIADAKRSLQAHFRMVRDAVKRHADADRAQETIDALNEIDHRISLKPDGVVELVERVEMLLEPGTMVRLTDMTKVRAAERAFARLAPFHRSRNSIGDAALIEIYAELLENAPEGRLFAFVTLNSHDFSHPQGDMACSLAMTCKTAGLSQARRSSF
ncbi:PIN domain-containing protein [Salinarimonas sp. NSM]|uniref:PIN domain-containing protein n=1 Tax=Salinarimonas sp. NSM TaxID=3458003 RepID=UPI004035A2E2